MQARSSSCFWSRGLRASLYSQCNSEMGILAFGTEAFGKYLRPSNAAKSHLGDSVIYRTSLNLAGSNVPEKLWSLAARNNLRVRWLTNMWSHFFHIAE